MLAVLWIILPYPFSFFRRRHDLALEVLVASTAISKQARL